jgi:hypothetical protein
MQHDLHHRELVKIGVEKAGDDHEFEPAVKPASKCRARCRHEPTLIKKRVLPMAFGHVPTV